MFRRLAALALDSDPAVRNAGVDAGIALSERTLRAADIAVNFEWAGGTWATHAPLVLLCAPSDAGSLDFNKKVDEFLAAGTRLVFVRTSPVTAALRAAWGGGTRWRMRVVRGTRVHPDPGARPHVHPDPDAR